MNISITFRQMDPSDAIKRHTTDKFAKLQKFLRQPLTAKVTLSLDRLEHVAEAHVSSGGEHLEAKERSPDIPFGTGVLDLGKILDAVRPHGFAGNVSIEYESNWKTNHTEIAQCAGYLRAYSRLVS